jgi:hypothetical protein
LNGVSRSDPNADTRPSIRGDLGGRSGRTDLLLRQLRGRPAQGLGGGTQAVVPAAALRTGDFSGTSVVVRDPRTGVAFPGNRIPEGASIRLRAIIEFFYPLPNRPPRRTAASARIARSWRSRATGSAPTRGSTTS